MQCVDDAAHALGCVVLNVLHVRVHDRQSELRHHPPQLVHPFLVGCDLRLQVSDILAWVARRITRTGEQRRAVRARGSGPPRRA